MEAAMAEALDWTDTRKDWRGAFAAMRKLLADPKDTVQVFRVMQALNRGTAARNYVKLLATTEGGRIAYRRVELVEKLTDRTWLSQFEAGTVGAAYRAFLDRTGFSADGLADVSKQVARARDEEHPFSWFGRRERDIHDVSHVLTGYRADEPLGELCLVAYTYAQNRGLGWGFIALMGTLKSLTQPFGRDVRRAVREGYRHGKQASWLHGEDIEKLFAEPIDAARARMNIARPVAYEAVQQKVSASTSSWLAATA
jgi:ubiquinone biosynthesis protein COQ4